MICLLYGSVRERERETMVIFIGAMSLCYNLIF